MWGKLRGLLRALCRKSAGAAERREETARIPAPGEARCSRPEQVQVTALACVPIGGGTVAVGEEEGMEELGRTPAALPWAGAPSDFPPAVGAASDAETKALLPPLAEPLLLPAEPLLLLPGDVAPEPEDDGGGETPPALLRLPLRPPLPPSLDQWRPCRGVRITRAGGWH